MKSVYKIISYFILTLVIVYIATGQYIIQKKLYNVGNFSFFTFSPNLAINSNTLKLQIKRNSKSLTLKFRERLKAASPLASTNKEIINYTVSLENNGKLLVITANDQHTLQDVSLRILISEATKAGHAKKRFITNVMLGNNDHSIPEFYNEYISHDYGNVYLYYPMDLVNISSYLALNIGKSFTYIIVSILLIFFVCQMLLFFISIIWQPEEVKDFFTNPTREGAITFIDDTAEHFAIPLGFLGTVVSIWVSLETAETDYKSFAQILEIIKIAIFTTVLGLSTKVICTIRSKLRGILNNSS